MRDPDIDGGYPPTWYEAEGEARSEFDRRDDKYWPSQLVKIDVTDIPVEVVEDGWLNPPDWVRGDV